MNKRMREILQSLEQKRVAAKGYMEGENKDFDKANSIFDEIDALEKEFETEKRLYESEKNKFAPTDDDLEEVNETKNAKSDGFKVLAKMVNRRRLDDNEKALITGGEDGEDLLVPEDVRLAINELRRQFLSAKDLVTVVPVNTLSGTTNWEDGNTGELSPLVDGETIATATNPKFIQKKWTINFFAKIIPVSNILAGAEKAGLMSYLNRWFVKSAIRTENSAIFTALKDGKTKKSIVGWRQLKESITVDLDPALLSDAVVVTNQNGFAALDKEEDDFGRPILQPNPANATEKLFQGLPVKVFSNDQLPNVSGKPPLFYGSLKEGVEFEDYQTLQFATSDDFFFNKNQKAIRVIEGFDVIQLDKDAYIYASFEGTPVEEAPAG